MSEKANLTGLWTARFHTSRTASAAIVTIKRPRWRQKRARSGGRIGRLNARAATLAEEPLARAALLLGRRAQHGLAPDLDVDLTARVHAEGGARRRTHDDLGGRAALRRVQVVIPAARHRIAAGGAGHVADRRG